MALRNIISLKVVKMSPVGSFQIRLPGQLKYEIFPDLRYWLGKISRLMAVCRVLVSNYQVTLELNMFELAKWRPAGLIVGERNDIEF